MKRYWILTKVYFASNDIIMWFCPSVWACGVFMFVILHMLNYPWISGMMPTWSWWIIFFSVFLNSGCRYYIENLCIFVRKGNCSVIFFLLWVFMLFRYQGNCDPIKIIRQFLLFQFCRRICGMLTFSFWWYGKVLHWIHLVLGLFWMEDF